LVYGFPLFVFFAGIIWFASGYIQYFVYGKEYARGEEVLKYLLIAFSCGAFLSPFASLAYRLNIPKVIFFIEAIRGVIGFMGFYFFIPVLGAKGAALSLLICYLVSLFFGVSFIYKKAILFKIIK